MSRIRSRRVVTACITPLVATAAFAARDPYSMAPPYLRSVSARANTGTLLTTGQQIPLTGGAKGVMFRFVGVPDGLGLAVSGKESARPRATLFVNHELHETEGQRAGPLPTGARITELVLERTQGRRPRPSVVSARWAVAAVFAGEPPQQVEPVTRGLAKLCSAFLADSRVGFDRPLFMNGEESRGEHNFDGRGGQAWVTTNGRMYAFPRMGRAEWENVVIAPFTGAVTIAYGLEDGPDDGDGLHSQLYMYVGAKKPGASDPLEANGLRGGMLYVAGSVDSSQNSEATLTARGASTQLRWLPAPWDVTDAELDQAVKKAGAFGFLRIEDGACDPAQPGALYFVTTGRLPREDAPHSCNERGRFYRYKFDPKNPLAGGKLEILLTGADGLVGPDNIDVNRHGEIAIEEDPGQDLRKLGLKRDASVWIYEAKSRRLHRVAAMNRASAVRHALRANPANRDIEKEDAPGLWESSGVIDAESFLGRGSWLLDVQAHSLRIDPEAETVQGGQLLWLRWR
jgi:hypothetical protein